MNLLDKRHDRRLQMSFGGFHSSAAASDGQPKWINKSNDEQPLTRERQVKPAKSLIILNDPNGHLKPERKLGSQNASTQLSSSSSATLDELLRLNQLRLSDDTRPLRPPDHTDTYAHKAINSTHPNRLDVLTKFSFAASHMEPMDTQTTHQAQVLDQQQQQHSHQLVDVHHEHQPQELVHHEPDYGQQQLAVSSDMHQYWAGHGAYEPSSNQQHQVATFDYLDQGHHLQYSQAPLAANMIEDYNMNGNLYEPANLVELNADHQQQQHQHQQLYVQNESLASFGQLEYADLDAQRRPQAQQDQQHQQHPQQHQQYHQQKVSLPESVIKANDQVASCSFSSSMSRHHQQFGSSNRSEAAFSELHESANYSSGSINKPTNVISCLTCTGDQFGQHLSQSLSYDQSFSSSQQTQLVCDHNHNHHQHHHHRRPSAITSTTTTTTSTTNNSDVHSSLESSAGNTTDSADCDELKVCEWRACNHTYNEMADFVRHLEEDHVNKEPKEKNKYYCLWANCKRNQQEFNARYKLLIHMRVHSGEKPYPCKSANCGKSFSRLENLKIHQRSHTGEKPYSCKKDPDCKKSFTNSSDRIKHHKTHQNPKPYTCSHDGCEKRYTDPSSLRKHLRAHKRHSQSSGYGQRPAPVQVACESYACLPTSDYDPSVDFGLDSSASHQQSFASHNLSSFQGHEPWQHQEHPQQQRRHPHQTGQVSYVESVEQPSGRWQQQHHHNNHHQQQQQHNQLSSSWWGQTSSSAKWRPTNEQPHWTARPQQPSYEASRPTEVVLNRHEQLMRSMPSQTSGLGGGGGQWRPS